MGSPAYPPAPRPRPVSPAARRPVSWRGLAWILFAAGLCVFFGYWAGRHGASGWFLPLPGTKAWKLAGLALLPLAWFVAVGVHEAGHLAGGWLGGGKFLLWVVGPVKVRRTVGGVKAGWNRHLLLAGGAAACLPFEAAKLTPQRMAVMILGGPLASLALAVAALWAVAGLGAGPLSTARALGQHGAIFTAGLSLLIFFAAAVPSVRGGLKSDGRRLLDYLRGGPRLEQQTAVLLLSVSSLAGLRPADWDRATVRRALALRDGSLDDLQGHMLAYYHAADGGEWAMAQHYLDRVMAGMELLPTRARAHMSCEQAWLIALTSGDAAAARAWLKVAGEVAFDPATRLRAEAAVWLAEGRKAEAAMRARQGLHALEHRSLGPVKSPFAEEALEEILRRAEGN